MTTIDSVPRVAVEQPPTVPNHTRWLPLGGAIAAGWALLPMFTGPTPALTVAPGREVADHFIPAVLILSACVAAVASRRRRHAGPALLGSGLAVLLAGVWMPAPTSRW